MECHWPTIKATVFTLLGSIMLVGFVFFSTPINDSNHGFDSDGSHYGVMAGETSFPPYVGNEAPWCYRILTPYLASLFPFSILTNFRILAFLSNVLSIVIFAFILNLLRFPTASCLFGILLYTGSFWTLKFSFYSPAYIDYQTQFFLLLIIYLTLKKVYIVLPLIFFIAVLQKESLGAYCVFSIIHIIRYDTIQRFWMRTLIIFAVVVTPLTAIFIVRYAIHVPVSTEPAIIISYIKQVFDPAFWPVFLQALFSGCGVIPILLLVNYQAWVRFVRCHWEWAVYALISIAFLFCGTDKARLFLYFLPLGVILAVHNLDFFKRYAAPRKLVLWGAIVLAFHWYIGGYFSPMGLFSDYLARMVPVHSDGRYVPYLILNISLGMVLFIFTVQYVMGGWFFMPTIGFTWSGLTSNDEPDG